MHELSIAIALVDLACEASADLGATRVDALHVRVGPLAGVVEEALSFSFELAAAGTPAEGARLLFERVPLVVFCSVCNEEKAISSPQHLRCPACDALTPEVRGGRDLQLTAVEIPDVTDC
jgi:hydrogenase nickel incorporation protein HypA/HybF